MLEKLQRAHPTWRGHFAPAYLVGSNMLRAYLFFIYGCEPVKPQDQRPFQSPKFAKSKSFRVPPIVVFFARKSK